MGNSSEPDRPVIFAVFAILAGLLSVLLIFSASLPAPDAPAGLLPYFNSHRAGSLFAAVISLMWVVVAIPFVVGVGELLASKGKTLSRVATLLCTGGILLLGFATFTFVGAFLAIVPAGNVAPTAADTTYQAAIWANLAFFLSAPV